MTVLQTAQGADAVLAKQQFFRINQKSVNNGDIFQINSSAKALIVGPQSDYSEYDVWYYDELKAERVNLATFSSDQPFLGQLNARGDVVYPSSVIGQNPGLKGKYIITPKDFYLPAFFTAATAQTRTIFAPCVDVIAYNSNPPAIPDKRPSKKINSAIRLEPFINEVYFPVYGRKTFTVRVVYANATPDVFATLDVSVQGIKFGLPAGDTFNNSFGSIDTLGNATSVDQDLGQSVGFTYNAEESSPWDQFNGRGRYDYLRVLILASPASDPSDVLQGNVQVLFEAHD